VLMCPPFRARKENSGMTNANRLGPSIGPRNLPVVVTRF
jgi:hypothetical protein